ncbi:MAG: SPOR domain-containing protein [Deltaproteobacteria bacterium]|nr:SPOR domain-containing protein [Deltaproteobacteria bacterium]
MRDLRKFRNKITLELDNRQIAFIFSGLLAILVIVFALGVVVGTGLGRLSAMEGSAEGVAPTPETIVAEGLTVTGSDIGATPAATPGSDTMVLPVSASPTPASAMPLPPPESGIKSPVSPGPIGAPAAMPPPAPVEPAGPPEPPTGTGWTVQLSAHSDEAEAKTRQQSWIGKGVQAYIVKAELGSKGTWYRLRVGKFANKSGADQYAAALAAKEGIKPYVTTIGP